MCYHETQFHHCKECYLKNPHNNEELHDVNIRHEKNLNNKCLFLKWFYAKGLICLDFNILLILSFYKGRILNLD